MRIRIVKPIGSLPSGAVIKPPKEEADRLIESAHAVPYRAQSLPRMEDDDS